MQLNNDMTQVPFATLSHDQQSDMNERAVPVNIDDYYSESEESGDEGKAMVIQKLPSGRKFPAWRGKPRKHKPSGAKTRAFRTTFNAEKITDTGESISNATAGQSGAEGDVEMKGMSPTKGRLRRAGARGSRVIQRGLG